MRVRLPFVSRRLLQESIEITRQALELARLNEELRKRTEQEASLERVRAEAQLTIAQTRYHALVEQLLAMRKEGFTPAPAQPSSTPPPVDPADEIPEVVWDAIREMAPRDNDPLRRHLVDFAIGQKRRWATEAADVAAEIRAGEELDYLDGAPDAGDED